MTKRSELGAGQGKWYQVVALFDGEAKRVMTVAQHDIVVRGTLNLGESYEQLAVCMMPQGLPQSHLEPIRQAVEGNLRLPVLLLTDNVHLCKLKPLTEKQATKLLAKHVEGPEKEKNGNAKDNGAEEEKAKVLAFERQKEGPRIRKVPVPPAEGDLRSAGAGGEAGGDEEAEKGARRAAEEEPGEAG
jgi:hypothetical protein